MPYKRTIIIWAAAFLLVGPVAAELAPEPVGRSTELPQPFPPHWIIVQDSAETHPLNGRLVLLDLNADKPADQYKGMVDASLEGSFLAAKSRPEWYVAETHYSRGRRGERTDVVTIYDKASLRPIGEVVLPPGKRAVAEPQKYAMRLINGGRLLLVFNFAPESSVTVIDIEKRAVLKDIAVPGCSLVYPATADSFASLCGDGTLLNYRLDKQGKVKARYRSQPFFDPSEDPLFDKAAFVKDTLYFPSFNGYMQEIQFSEDGFEVKDPWSFVKAEAREQGWRPGGSQLIDVDSKGRLYLLMHPNATPGSHQNSAKEVWVVDPRKRGSTRRIPLKRKGISVAVTRGKEPILVITSTKMKLDLYSATSGDYLRTVAGFGEQTPVLVHRVRPAKKKKTKSAD